MLKLMRGRVYPGHPFLARILPLWILYISAVDLTNSQAIDLSKCDAYTQRGNGVVCYTKTGWKTTWLDAQQQCRALNKTLLSVATVAENNAIGGLLVTMVDTWLGATSFGGTWTWLDGTELLRQGCFLDNQSNPDMTIATNISANSPASCTALCAQLGYAYAGLESGTLCSCDNSFGRYGQIGAQCISPCPPGTVATCGGPTSQDIIAIQGSYSNWESGQPDNMNQNQNCAVLDTSQQPYQWYDVSCTDQNWAICQTYNPSFPCNSQNGAVQLSSGSCVYLNSTPNSYFNARVACTARGGDLAQLKTELDNQEVTRFISTTTGGTYRYYIGLVKLQWKWESGEAFLYTNWDKNEPTAPGQNCTRMQPPNDMWDNADCNAARQFICQETNNTINIYQSGLITVAATTARPSLGPALSAVTGPTTQSTSRSAGLALISTVWNDGSSTVPVQKAGLDVPMAAGIAGGVGGFFLILIIIIIIVCCLRCRKAKADKKDAPAQVKDIDIPGSYYFGIENENSNPPPHSPLMAGNEKTDSGSSVHYDNHSDKADIKGGNSSTFKN